MKLHLDLPKNLMSRALVLQNSIPCTCRVSNVFEIALLEPLVEVHGVVEGWDAKEIAQRAPAGAGGKYTHCRPGLVTLQEVDQKLFEVRALSMFYESFGWLAVVVDGEYATPNADIWDKEED